MTTTSRILCPIDLSVQSAHSVTYALAMARVVRGPRHPASRLQPDLCRFFRYRIDGPHKRHELVGLRFQPRPCRTRSDVSCARHPRGPLNQAISWQ